MGTSEWVAWDTGERTGVLVDSRSRGEEVAAREMSIAQPGGSE